MRGIRLGILNAVDRGKDLALYQSGGKIYIEWSKCEETPPRDGSYVETVRMLVDGGDCPCCLST